MNEHPIEGLMVTAMNSIQDMIDVNTIIGEPIETSNNIMIIPISKVTFGFAAGGSEFSGETIDEYSKKEKEEQIQYRLPFGGGSGAGVTINPVAFIVISQNNVKLLPVNHASSLDKLLDYIPDLIEKTNNIMNRCISNKKEETKEILKQMRDKEKQTKEEVKTQTEEKVGNTIRKVTKQRKIKKQEHPEIKDVEYEYEYDETKGQNNDIEPDEYDFEDEYEDE